MPRVSSMGKANNACLRPRLHDQLGCRSCVWVCVGVSTPTLVLKCARLMHTLAHNTTNHLLLCVQLPCALPDKPSTSPTPPTHLTAPV